MFVFEVQLYIWWKLLLSFASLVKVFSPSSSFLHILISLFRKDAMNIYSLSHGDMF